jgi:Zn finger protein HypA/HybF involved in hydrogenase expression
MKRWWCMDCRNAVTLDKHGRCGNCESEAIDLIDEKNSLTGPISASQVSTGGTHASA